MSRRLSLFVAAALMAFCAPNAALADNTRAARSNKIFGTAKVPGNYVAEMRRLADDSISWSQPESSLFGYNGYCGHVAWANAVTMYTGKRYDPSYFRYFSSGDFSPGLRPRTLQRALHRATSRRFGISWHLKRFSAQSAWNNLVSALNQRYFGAGVTPLPVVGPEKSPVLVLVQRNTTTYHWLTIVNIQDARHPRDRFVTANDRGRQTTISYASFMKSWAFEEHQNPATAIMQSPAIAGRYAAILPITH